MPTHQRFLAALFMMNTDLCIHFQRNKTNYLFEVVKRPWKITYFITRHYLGFHRGHPNIRYISNTTPLVFVRHWGQLNMRLQKENIRSFIRFHRCVFMCCHWCISLTSLIIMTYTLKLLFNLLLITIINWCISQVGVALCSPQTRITSCQQRRDYITVIFFVNFCYSSTNKKIWRQNIIREHAQYSSMPFISVPPP